MVIATSVRYTRLISMLAQNKHFQPRVKITRVGTELARFSVRKRIQHAFQIVCIQRKSRAVMIECRPDLS